MMAASISVKALKSEVLLRRIGRITSHVHVALKTEYVEIRNDMIFEGYILASANRKVLEPFTPRM